MVFPCSLTQARHVHCGGLSCTFLAYTVYQSAGLGLLPRLLELVEYFPISENDTCSNHYHQ